MNMEIAAVGSGPSKQLESVQETMQLPDRAVSIDAARFDQMLRQAQQDNLAIEVTNPSSSLSSPGVTGVLNGINSSSKDYLGAVDNGLKALSELDLTDPKSIQNMFEHFSIATVQGIQLSVVLGEVSNSKKSVQELFHNQG